MAKVKFLPTADNDYQQSLNWYAAQSERAADNFENAVAKTIQKIVDNPGMGQWLDDESRFQRVPRYPFHIVYWYDSDEVVIKAVAHGSRHPNYWTRQ